MPCIRGTIRITPPSETDPGRGLNGRRRRPAGSGAVRLPVSPALEDFSDAFPEASGRLSAGQNIRGKENMPLYEHVFLARQDVSSQQVEA